MFVFVSLHALFMCGTINGTIKQNSLCVLHPFQEPSQAEQVELWLCRLQQEDYKNMVIVRSPSFKKHAFDGQLKHEGTTASYIMQDGRLCVLVSKQR